MMQRILRVWAGCAPSTLLHSLLIPPQSSAKSRARIGRTKGEFRQNCRSLGTGEEPVQRLDHFLGVIVVKKLILLVTGFSVLATGAYFSSGLLAQPNATTPSQPDKGTKVAVVNIGYVFSKYKRAETMKKELEGAFAPFKDK